MAAWLRARTFLGAGALVGAGLGVVAACGGSSTIHPVAVADDAAVVVPDAGGLPDAAPSSCPPSPPVDDTACDAPGLWCEYGGVAHSRCTTRAICFKKSGTGGAIRWTTFPPDYSCAPNDDACPLEFAPRATCPAVPGVCDYAQGRCTCAECAGADGGHASQWLCRAWSDVGAFLDDGGAANVPGACPAERPRLGTPCADQGFVCGYDACYGVPLGPYLACTNGTWAVGPQTDLCNPPACN
jgi:hypothetical protein